MYQLTIFSHVRIEPLLPGWLTSTVEMLKCPAPEHYTRVVGFKTGTSPFSLILYHWATMSHQDALCRTWSEFTDVNV